MVIFKNLDNEKDISPDIRRAQRAVRNAKSIVENLISLYEISVDIICNIKKIPGENKHSNLTIRPEEVIDLLGNDAANVLMIQKDLENLLEKYCPEKVNEIKLRIKSQN